MAMTFLEKNLEDIIFSTPNEKLRERGLPIKGGKKRQVMVGNYGVLDLISFFRNTNVHEAGVYQNLYLNIYELKQDRIDHNTLIQAARYVKGVKSYLRTRFENLSFEVDMTLIGRTISNGDWVYLIDEIYNLSVYTYSYEFDGIRFKDECGYYLKDSGF